MELVTVHPLGRLSKNLSSSSAPSTSAQHAEKYIFNHVVASQTVSQRHLEMQGMQGYLCRRSLRVCHQCCHHRQGHHEQAQETQGGAQQRQQGRGGEERCQEGEKGRREDQESREETQSCKSMILSSI